ncbi:MAG TPA: hypothetical protein VMW64_10590 [Dehalococcoidia bacterium]|nr:hypothetical protein [Dehalococcoidia bacterium]
MARLKTGGEVFGNKRLTGYIEDVPIGAGRVYSERDLSNRLPASLAGRYELKSFEPKIINVDPVVLRNRWHQIIYQWPDGYIPSWVDVLNTCKQLGIN